MSEDKEFGAASWVLTVIGVILALIFLFGSWFVIDPTERGVTTTLGHMSEQFIGPGVGTKWPLITDIQKVNIQQQTQEMQATCSSSDLQDIDVKVKVLFRTPEGSVVRTVRDYSGDPFTALVVPRVQEALKEVTAQRTAVDIVKGREEVKRLALIAAKEKIGNIVEVVDLVIEDVGLSKELEAAIEQKMVQQQEAEKASYIKQKAQTDAETAVIAAQGQAQSLRIQGDAIAKNPSLIQLKMVEKWNGVMPLYTGSGANLFLAPPAAAAN